jgi:hypothetical protein
LRNNYRIEEEIVYISLYSKKHGKFEAIIDKSDLDFLLHIDALWYPHLNKTNNSFYAHYTKYLGMFNGKPKYKTIALHKSLIDPENKIKNLVIDHIDTNTLNNRRYNLRIVTQQKNLMNRKSENSNSSTGERNVSFSSSENRYIVQLQVNGKNTCLGKFKQDQLEEAAKFAEQMRLKYYGEFAGKS